MTLLASTAEGEILTSLIERLVQRSGMVTLHERRFEVLTAARELAGADWACLENYFQKISKPENVGALDELIERLTIGETYFLRHPEVFAALENEVFPSWLAASDPIQVWSAACSIGCEPYSLVIAWKEFLTARQMWGPDLSVLGTDLNTNYLQQARDAIYSSWCFRNLSPGWINTFCEPRDEKFLLKEPYRKGVSFQRFNLLDAPSSIGLVDGTLDVIFCRNVMIYFDQATISRLAQTFHRLLKPGGWLIPGASECNTELFSSFSAVNFAGAVFYKKEGNPQAVPSLRNFSPWEPPVFSPPKKSRQVSPAPPDSSRAEVVADILAGHCEQALEKISRQLQLQKMNPDWHFLLGLVQEITEIPDAAEASYRKCLYLSRDHLEAQVNLALLLMRLNRTEAANRAKRVALRSLENSALAAELLCPQGTISVERIRHLLNPESSSLA
jgi:chemotaxis protein methyltransferase CheR